MISPVDLRERARVFELPDGIVTDNAWQAAAFPESELNSILNLESTASVSILFKRLNLTIWPDGSSAVDSVPPAAGLIGLAPDPTAAHVHLPASQIPLFGQTAPGGSHSSVGWFSFPSPQNAGALLSQPMSGAATTKSEASPAGRRLTYFPKPSISL